MINSGMRNFWEEEEYENFENEEEYSIPLPPNNLVMPDFIQDDSGALVPPMLDSIDFSDFENDDTDIHYPESSSKFKSFKISKDYTLNDGLSSLKRKFNPTAIKDCSSILIIPELKDDNLNKSIKPADISRFFIEEYAMAFNLPLNCTDNQILYKIKPYSIHSYAKTHFRKHHIPNYNMKYFSTDELTSFSDKPLYKMLLKKVPDEKKEIGRTISYIILKYAKVIESDNIDTLPGALVSTLKENTDVIDEAYFQLIKYSINCPDRNALCQVWKLWLIIGTLFPVSEDVRPYIFAFLIRIIFKCQDPLGEVPRSQSTSSLHSNKNHPPVASESNNDIKDTTESGNSIYQTDTILNTFAKFVFLRMFERTFKIGLIYTKEMSKEVFANMPKIVRFGRSMFSCSLYEVVWCQRRFYPLLPVPITLYLILNQIKKNGGLLTPEFLVLKNKPGSRSIMNAWIDKLPFDVSIINDGEINELVALLFYFLFNITDSVIPKVCADVFIEKCESKNYDQIFRSLPSLHLNTLKYLIGFLQDVNSSEQYNKMTKEQIADIFSQFFVETHKKIIEPFKRYKMNELCNGFIIYCIDELDCSDMYPLKPEYTKRVEPKAKKPIGNAATKAATAKPNNNEAGENNKNKDTDTNNQNNAIKEEKDAKNNENKNKNTDNDKNKEKTKDKRKDKHKDKHKDKGKDKHKSKNKD